MKTICLDFDGVIHSSSSPWTVPEEIPDPPVPGAFNAIRSYIKSGIRVAVFSARSSSEMATCAMRKWFALHGGQDILDAWLRLDENQQCGAMYFPVEKPPAVLYVDDRAWLFMGNNFPTLADIENFTPWNKKSPNAQHRVD